MNKAILVGRLTRDPDIRYSQGENSVAVARYTLAVDRRFKRANESQDADFISCVSFGKTAEFVERYFTQGMKMGLLGEYKQVAILIKKDRRFTPQMLLSKKLNL